ncbi:hypothetical protein ACFZAG_40235 [Streptomyces sp. NPDC012403]|uniref:hypothetical protein n=1 Tax=Streptomyces sp. NPDC012403 TaxID=3364831 RepID=UPI0036EB5400
MSGGGVAEGAEKLAWQAADHGRPDRTLYVSLYVSEVTLTMLWPYGRDPDGTPTRRWQ